MAARSVLVNLQNQTTQTLTRMNFGLRGGIWSSGPNGQMVPPEQIPPQKNSTWQSESNGFMTGTEGFADYEIGSGGDPKQIVSLIWKNPFRSKNSYPSSISIPNNYRLEKTDGQGNNAAVTFTLHDS
jgi:hypothetical protein